MEKKLKLYNTLDRALVDFKPKNPKKVTIYWCGPTTYAPPHLGHARSAIVLDLLLRTLKYLLHYPVQLVRNITDVGHLLGDIDEGEDKITQAARLSAVSPMEIVQRYTEEYHTMLRELGTYKPQIEPRATAHIPQQIALVQRLIKKNFAYEVNGSIYFDLPLYHAQYGYGKLSGRKIDNHLTGTRTLTNTSEKRSPLDFALWKKASPNHLMQWDSPWGKGFPGWHLECTVMSHAYLDFPFDIHGGGIDLTFPHHECEIAQAEVAYGKQPANYWIHHNLVTLAGKKMSKSANHSISLSQCLQGSHPLLSQAYNPMAVRLLLQQAHYRSPLDLSDHSLQAAQKGYYKLLNGLKILKRLSYPDKNTSQENSVANEIESLCQACHHDLYNDLNTPKVIAHLFDLLKHLHRIDKGEQPLHELPPTTWKMLRDTYTTFIQQILGLREEHPIDFNQLLETLIKSYTDAKRRKDYALVDQIRASLQKQGITLQDKNDQVTWQYI